MVQKIIENVERRFAWWKKLEVSKRGSLWQENTSSSIPIYFMSSFMMHTHETKKLEILQKHFLWGIGDTKNSHLVN